MSAPIYPTHSPVARKIKDDGTKGRWVTLETARKNGLLKNPSQWEAHPGVFINLSPVQGTKRVISSDKAKKLLLAGLPVLYNKTDSEWVPAAKRFVGTHERIPFRVNPAWDSDTKAEAHSLLDSFEGLPSPVKVAKWYEFLADVGKPYKKGMRLAVNLQLANKYTCQLRKSGATVERVGAVQTGLPAIIVTLPRSMTESEVVDYAVRQYHDSVTTDSYQPTGYELVGDPKITVMTHGLEDEPMGRLEFTYTEFPDEITKDGGQCVVDYILWEFSKVDSRRKGITRDKIIAKLGCEQPTTKAIIEFAKAEKDVSVYALTPLLQVFASHKPEFATRATLVFIVNNGHCYPITDPLARKAASGFGRINLEDFNLTAKDYESAAVCNCDEKDREGIKEWLALLAPSERVAVLPVHEVSWVAASEALATKTLVTKFKRYNGNMSAFKCPTRDLVVVAAHDYHKRKAVCEKFFQMFRLRDFVFTNQSWGMIGRTIQECFVKLPHSTYSKDFQNILENHPMKPYQVRINESVNRAKAADKRLAHTSYVKNADFTWNVFGMFDYMRPYKGEEIVGGEYVIKHDFKMGFDAAGVGHIHVPASVYPHNFVQYALNRGYITKSSISHVMTASQQLPADTFKEFVETFLENFPDAKMAINSWVGCLGVLHERTERCGATANVSTAMATAMTLQQMENTTVELVWTPASTESATDYDDYGKDYTEEKEVIAITAVQKQMRTYGDMGIHRQIIAQGWVELDKTTRSICKPGTEVIGYNTDCVWFRGPYNTAAVKKKEDCKPGEIHIEKDKLVLGRTVRELIVPPPFVAPVREEIVEVAEAEAVEHLATKGGALITGIGGSGKTEIARMLVERFKADGVLTVRCKEGEKADALATAYTHKACENLKERGIFTQTFRSLVFNAGTQRPDVTHLKDVKILILDEYTMLPPEDMSVLIEAKSKYGLKVVALGDPEQQQAVSDTPVDYHLNPVFWSLVDNTHVLCNYKPGLSRYDEALHAVIEEFRATGAISSVFRKAPVECWRHLTRTNKKRETINQLCLARWAALHGKTLTDVGGLKVAEGLEVMCYHETDKVLKVFKTQEWVVTAITDTSIRLSHDGESIELGHDAFAKLFDYAFAATVSKYQGGKIAQPFTIHEVNKMDKKAFYTAISRGTKLDHVHLANVDWTRTYASKIEPLFFSIKPTKHTMSLGRVYRITCESGMTYIGQTVKDLSVRLAEHLEHPTNERMKEELNDKATIELLEEFYFTSEKKLREVEDEWIKREFADKGDILNHQGKPKPPKPSKPVVVKKKKIEPREEVAKNRFVVRLEMKSVEASDQRRNFSYAKECSREDALAAALEWCAALSAKYF